MKTPELFIKHASCHADAHQRETPDTLITMTQKDFEKALEELYTELAKIITESVNASRSVCDRGEKNG